MKGIVVGLIVGLVFYALIAAFKGTSDKVVEYKAKHNPDDYKSLLKLAGKNIEKGNIEEGIEQCEEILKKHPDNIEANLIAGNFNYKLNRFERAKPILAKIVKDLLYDNDDLIWKLSVKGNQELIGYAFYFYGHLCHLDEKYEEAQKWKTKSFSISNVEITDDLY